MEIRVYDRQATRFSRLVSYQAKLQVKVWKRNALEKAVSAEASRKGLQMWPHWLQGRLVLVCSNEYLSSLCGRV